MRTPHILILKELGWEDLATRRKYHCLLIMYKITNGFAPNYVFSLCPPRRQDTVNYNLRNEDHIINFYCRLNPFKHSFFPFTIKHWNLLSTDMRESSTIDSFRCKLSKDLLSNTCKLFSQHALSFLLISPYRENIVYQWMSAFLQSYYQLCGRC